MDQQLLVKIAKVILEHAGELPAAPAAPAAPSKKPKGWYDKSKYVQPLVDTRQFFLLHPFVKAPKDYVHNWHGHDGLLERSKGHGFKAGNGLVKPHNGKHNRLFEYTDESKTLVRVTDYGRKRYEEIVERGYIVPEPTAA